MDVIQPQRSDSAQPGIAGPVTVIRTSCFAPIATLPLPIVFKNMALSTNGYVIWSRWCSAESADQPNAVFAIPSVFDSRAKMPTATLAPPAVFLPASHSRQ